MCQIMLLTSVAFGAKNCSIHLNILLVFRRKDLFDAKPLNEWEELLSFVRLAEVKGGGGGCCTLKMEKSVLLPFGRFAQMG